MGVPIWYWWALAAPIVAIGAARDSGDLIVQAITIPLAVLVMAVLIGAAIPELRRRVQVYSSTQARARIAAAIIGMIVLVDGVIVGTAISLNAARYHPGTIGCAAGAAVLVIVGPLVNRYGRRLMLRQARQQLSGAPQAAGTP